MNVLKQLLEYIRHLLTLTQAIEQNRQETKELQQQVEQLTEIVQGLAYDLRYSLNDEKHEREKLVLRLENELLRFERRLPQPDEQN
jgi:hypothetical protein